MGNHMEMRLYTYIYVYAHIIYVLHSSEHSSLAHEISSWSSAVANEVIISKRGALPLNIKPCELMWNGAP